jgi:NADH dehydrogenase
MILVIGGTGLVGSRVVEGLLSMQCPTRVLSAGHSDWNNNVVPAFRKAGVEIIAGDMRDQRVLAEAVTGCTGIVHAAGIINARPGQSLESVNVASLASLIPIAESAGVQRFLYVSCLGSTQFSSSHYFRSKWQAEELVRQSNFVWTIFRPALIFGPGCQLLRGLEFWLRRFPIALTVGSGLNEIGVVSAEDVAACVAQSVYNRDTVGKTFNLVGPESKTLAEILEQTSLYLAGQEKPTFSVPASLAYALADVFSRLNPRAPISGEFLRLISADLTGDPLVMQTNFKVECLPLESCIKSLSMRR